MEEQAQSEYWVPSSEHVFVLVLLSGHVQVAVCWGVQSCAGPHDTHSKDEKRIMMNRRCCAYMVVRLLGLPLFEGFGEELELELAS